MFGKGVKIFSLFGFDVRIDPSWLIIAVLITWTLAEGFFPYYYQDLSGGVYWTMGVIGALGLFLSIIFHEFAHSLVARKFGMNVKSITLFLFGGVSGGEEEPSTAKAEFSMAIVGPLSSLFLGVFFYLLYSLGVRIGWSVPTLGVLYYLMIINTILAIFNMVPAFPLDGGRVLRSILWGIKNNLRWATRVASGLGSIFAYAIIFFGILFFLEGAFIAGIWWFLIGFFLLSAARFSYENLLRREALEGEPVRRFMEPDPVAAPGSIPISELVEEYIYKHHFKAFPVVENEQLIGLVSTTEIKEVPRKDWDSLTVREIMQPITDENTLSPDDDAVKTLSLMHRTGNSRLMVVEQGKLVGIISLKDLLRFLSLKLDLEEREE